MLPLAQSSSQDLTGLAGFVADVVAALGPVGVFVLVLGENLFPPIPSEVVLPLSGFLAGQGRMSVVAVLVAATLGSVLGALLLYGLGAKVGAERLAHALDRIPLTGREDLEHAQDWFGRHGGTAVLVGRCVPGVRSLVSIPAGVARMPLARFTLYTTLGSGVWNAVLVVLGYQLGQRWTTVGEYSDLLSAAVLGGLGAALAWVLVRRYRRSRRSRR
ncbi:MAG TPA: DedA family protein [Mycobacteriales bacterium]|nr:DedA family protein [Mycobacteriales bacterium]